MAGEYWGGVTVKLLDQRSGTGKVLSQLGGPNIGEIIATGMKAVIDNIDYSSVAVQETNGNVVTGFVADEELAEFQVTEVQIPANFAGLEAVMVPTRLMDQLFEITEVDEQDDYVEVVAVHIFYQQRQNTTLWEPIDGNEYTAAAACRNVLDYAMFPVDFSVASDCTDKLPGSELDFARKNIVDAFLNPETGLCKKFDLSLIRDNDRFYCLKNVGFDRGFVVEGKKNLLGVQRNENIEDIVTRIAPVGYDPDGKIVWLDYNGKKYVDSPHVTDYARPKLGLYDTGLQIGRDGVTADNIQAKLLEEAQKQFSEKQVDLPAVTMTVEFVSLGDTEEYQQYRGLDKVYLFDIIHIKEEERGYLYAAQVIGVEHDILRGRLNSATIGTPEKWDGVRKVATWQIPEISGDNIRLGSIRAGSFQTNAIHSADIKSGAVEARHFSQSADSHFETIFAEQLIVSNTSEDGLLHTRFAVTEGLIQAEVTRATGAEGALGTRITQTAEAITLEATRATNAESALSGQLTVEAGKVAMVVGTRTTQSGEENYIKAGEITLAINNAGESEAHIDANKVYIGNDKSTTVIAGKLNASDVTANYIQAKISDIAILLANALSVAGGINGSGTLTVAGLTTLNGSLKLGSGNSFNKCIVSAEKNGDTLKLTDSAGNVVNFSKAASTSLSGSWSGNKYTVTASPQGNTISDTISMLTQGNGSTSFSVSACHTSAVAANEVARQNLYLTEDTSAKKVYARAGSASGTAYGGISTQATYDAGYSAGDTVGYTRGYTAGMVAGIAQGYKQGWNEALTECGVTGNSGTVYSGGTWYNNLYIPGPNTWIGVGQGVGNYPDAHEVTKKS